MVFTDNVFIGSKYKSHNKGNTSEETAISIITGEITYVHVF
jgi:hypothetical protein